MTIKDIIGPSPWQLLRDYLQMLLGTVIYTVGYACFLLPYKIVSGGVTGISTILYYLTGFPAGNTYLIINVGLLLMAMRILGWRYLVRTIIVTLLISSAIGIMQTQLTVSRPRVGFRRKYTPTATPHARTEKMNCLSDSPKNIDSV